MSTSVGPWVQPDDTVETGSFFTSIRVSRGTPVLADQESWEASLAAAAAGFDLTPGGLIPGGVASVGESIATLSGQAQVQQSRLSIGFSYPWVHPSGPLPPGAITYEFEAPAGAAIPGEDATADGTYTTNIVNSLGEYDNTGFSLFRVTATDQPWYAPADLGSAIVTATAGVYNEADAVERSFTFDFTDDELFLVWQSLAVQNGIMSTRGVGGATWRNPAFTTSRLYRPARYRFIFATGGRPLRQRQRVGRITARQQPLRGASVRQDRTWG